MTSVSDNYVRLLYQRYKHFATWLPNVKVQLGDVGIVEGKYFKQLTTLRNLGVDFAIRAGDKPMAFNDDLTAGLQVQSKASGEMSAGMAVPLAQAGVRIEFTNKGAFLFHAINCYADEIVDKASVGRALIALGDNWDLSWSVVDTVVRAGSATVLLSNSRNANLELKAKTDAEISNLANPELGLEVISKKGDVTHFLGEEGLTPLFRLSRFHRSWIEWLLRKPKILHFGGTRTTISEPDMPILDEVTPDLS